MPVLLSDEEMNALKGVTDFQFRLYVQGIRKYMDYKTGVVGVKRKISLQSLCEETFVEPGQGKKNTGTKSRYQAHRAIVALEKAGVIRVKSVSTNCKKQLILECLLARTDGFEQNKPATFAQHSPTPEVATLNYKENSIKIEGKEVIESEIRNTTRTTRSANPAIPPVSGKNNYINIRAREKENEKIEFMDVVQIFYDYGYRLEQVQGNTKTIAMIRTWIDAGIILSHIKNTIEAVIALKTEKPHPTYFLKAVLEMKTNLEKAKIVTNEIKNERSEQRIQKNNSIKDTLEWINNRRFDDNEDEVLV